MDVVKECVELGLEQVKPWGFMGVWRSGPEACEENGYSVVREIGGHGVGIEFRGSWAGYIGQRGTGMMLHRA